MPEKPEIPLPELLESHTARFGRVIAVAIVLTTLVGALCGYMQARALQRNDETLTRAQQWSALAARISDETQQGEQLQLARFHRAEADRLQSSQATGERLWAGRAVSVNSSAGRAASVNSPAGRLQQLAGQTDTGSRQIAAGMAAEFAAIDKQDNADLLDGAALQAGDGASCAAPPWASPATHAVRSPPAVGDNTLGEGPNQDPSFPTRYLADDRREGYRLDALREAANTEAAAGEKQFTRYAVSLASLAVVVFLLGYSLTPHGRAHRKLYAGVAGVILAGASLWGIYAAARGPATASPESAAAYADGRVALDRAETDAGYAPAIRYLTCAIELQPDSALAYEWRAAAFVGNTTNSFLLTPARRDNGLRDAERARELGSNDPRLLNTLAILLDASGVSHHDLGQIAEVLKLVRHAHGRDPSNPVFAFNIADALLTLGRPSATAYATAERLAAVTRDTSTPGSELTALEFIAASRFGRERQSAIIAARRSIVASLAAGSQVAGRDVPPASVQPGGAPTLSVSISDRSGQPTVSPGQAEFFVDAGRGFDPRRDRLYAVWYHRSESHWQEVPSVSGPVEANSRSGLSRDNRGRLFSIRGSTSQCLPSGPYRVELYVNGVMAGQATQTSTVGDLVNLRLPNMLFGACRPPSWQRTPNRRPGLIEGYVSPAHDAALLILDASAGAPTDRASGPVLHQALQVFHSVLPAGLSHRTATGNEFAGGLCRELVEEYTYPGGELVAGIGRDALNREIVGVVYGPLTAFSAPASPFSASDLFASMASDETCTS